ncbi:hypothetical protein TrRE_jg2413 [Triparma retinervis]|uniref:Peptidase C1A papain C-terminal domain-containing protein n=1 Tax=Triparma retinervis TaxID=2557542 RepID=A0A9W7DUT6_9STRA|nr:hypothetical protein TrRE_jg2413 [Triparma retinervis]
MKLTAALLFMPFMASAAKFHHGHGFSQAENRQEVRGETLSVNNVPKELDFRAYGEDERNYVSAVRNQHIPNYCGACYIFAATSALADRIRLARGDTSSKEVDLAVQSILNCDTYDNGCHGGDPITVYQYIHENGIPEETCQLYAAEGHDTGRTCNAIDVCMDCAPGSSTCTAVDDSVYYSYGVDEYGLVNGTDAMINELQRGPIACTVAVTDDFENYDGGIFEDTTGDTSMDHSISLVGYGTDENGVDYWIGRNSWGTYWGEGGFFQIVRGTNNLGIEANCQYAVPSAEDNQKWTKDGDVEEVILTPRPHTTISSDDLPENWDWRNVNGVNYVTWDKNQHIPQYCGSCWAQGVTSALSDRLYIQSGAKGAQVNLSPQYLINFNGGGTCSGGMPAKAYRYIQKNGIVDQTCAIYEAENLGGRFGNSCNDQCICKTCSPNATSFSPGTCEAVTEFPKYTVTEYGKAKGIDEMKAEIYARGPIGCGIDATNAFEEYTGGIYEEEKRFPMVNHEISIAGWGKDPETGVEYWIGRNSWGEWWGENGWFRIKMGGSNLAVESECDWGVPAAL